jgi:hypothetical protein
MSWLRWVPGRQNGGYDKMLLAQSKRLKFDLYLLRFHEGSDVKNHRDPCPEGFSHHRVNWTLRFADAGGLTLIEMKPGTNNYRYEERRLYRFRPDIQRHFVTHVKRGSILMVSFGWLTKGTTYDV